jgi:hypothetical protein
MLMTCYQLGFFFGGLTAIFVVVSYFDVPEVRPYRHHRS